MQSILGPFNPYLQDALVREIVRYKKSEPLCPLLILVPSDSLRRWLKVLLAKEHSFNLLNVHIRTFYQLSLRLLEEGEGSQDLPLQDNVFFEEILRQIIRKGLPGAAPFIGLEEKTGGCAALWQTFRDLKDGTVDPSIAAEAAKGGLFGEEGGDQAERLFALFETFLSCCREWNLQDYSDLDLLAVERAGSSLYLKQFTHIFYYGFYDLTQVQLDLFRVIARQYPTTLLFPLLQERPQQPAWIFAGRFYERYLHGFADRIQTQYLTESSDPTCARGSPLPLFAEEENRLSKPKLDHFPVTIFSCFGGHDETDTVAKEILRLVSEQGISFDEVGVVARSLDPYLSWIKQIFSEHCIPFATPAEEPLVQYPLAKAVLLLINLPLRDYLRSHVIDLIGSPFFRSAPSATDATRRRPDLWDLLTRRLGITKGVVEWRRLEREKYRDIALVESADDDEKPKRMIVPASEVRALWNLFADLHNDLETLPKEASWSHYVKAWQALLKKWLSIDPPPASEPSSRQLVEKTVLDVLQRLSSLDAVGERISLSHFLQTYQYWLGRASVPLPDMNVKGVAVLDAMAARGISFRALFVLGLNEGLFPRTIREDAFLRDGEREALETVLGYKVAAKLGGFDEERLLFALLVGAAKERLYFLYQRTDESGRSLAPSWYLSELDRVFGPDAIRKIYVPRGIVEKEALDLFNRRDLVPPQELAIRLILTSKDATPLVDRCLPSPSFYSRGRRIVERLESTMDRLAAHDGIVGPPSEYWERICQKGLSPTSLESYARCPFQFFARTLLGLERLERPEQITGPTPADVGQIVHLILKSFYQELLDRQFFLSNEKFADPMAILKTVAQKMFREFELNNPIGYPLAWEILQEGTTMLLNRAVAQDLRNLAESGYRPSALEFETADRLPETWPSPLGGLRIRGRLDRIDYRPQDHRYRVIDYKVKSKKSPSPEDKDLLRAALRGQRLQPPFYLLLGKIYAQSRNRSDQNPAVDAAFFFLAPQWPQGPLVVETFPGDAWQGESADALKEGIAFLAEGIREGLFFIQPDEKYCRYCEVSEICRKTHSPTAWRAEKDPRSRAHLALRDKEPR